MSTHGFGTPGVNCPVSFGDVTLDEELYGALAARASGEIRDEEYGAILGKLRIKLKLNKIDRIIGKLEKLLRQEKMDKARSKAEKLAKVVNKLEALDPDYAPDQKVKSWLAFADGTIDDPRLYGKASASAVSTSGLFDTARAINAGTVTYAPTYTTQAVRRRSHYPALLLHPGRPSARPHKRRPAPPRMAKTHGPRPGAKARAKARYGEAYIGASAFTNLGNTNFPIDRVDMIEEEYGAIINREDLFDDDFGAIIDREDLFDDDFGAFWRSRAGEIRAAEKKISNLQSKRERVLHRGKDPTKMRAKVIDIEADIALAEINLEELQRADRMARAAPLRKTGYHKAPAQAYWEEAGMTEEEVEQAEEDAGLEAMEELAQSVAQAAQDHHMPGVGVPPLVLKSYP